VVVRHLGLHLRAVRGRAAAEQAGEGSGDAFTPLEELPLLLLRQAAEPPGALPVGLRPALLGLVRVGVLRESLEHLGLLQWHAQLQSRDRVLDGTDHRLDPCPLAAQPLGVTRQRGDVVRLSVQDPGHLFQGQAEFPQHEDALQAQQLPIPVEPVASRPRGGGREQADRVVVPQGAGCHSADAGEFLCPQHGHHGRT